MNFKLKQTNKAKRPRISLNPLCEYVEAGPYRRSSIIKNSKEPPLYITRYYNVGEELLTRYLSQVRDKPIFLRLHSSRLRLLSHNNDSEAKNAKFSSEALLSFLSHEKSIRKKLSAYSIETSLNDNTNKVIINGVQISIRPELLLRDSEGKQQLGFMKLYFSKTEPLTRDRAELIATVGKHYFETEKGIMLNSKHCMVLDVFRGTLFNAPKSFKRRIWDIEAACQEIFDRWDMIAA